MKPSNFLILLNLLIALGVGACSRTQSRESDQSHSPLAPSSASTTAIDGGSDGTGGGDAIPSGAPSAQTVYEAIGAAHAMVEQVLNFQELCAHQPYFVKEALARLNRDALQPDHDTLMRGLRKLFPESGKTATDILSEIKFHAEVTGPCHDTKWNDKDGSAFNADPNEICFSVTRLRQKAQTTDLAAVLLGLAVHEVSHRMGASEEEAVALQKFVQPTIRVSTFSDLRDQIYMYDLNSDIQNLSAQIAKPTPWSCSEIQALSVDLAKFEEDVEWTPRDMGIVRLRYSGVKALSATVLINEFGLHLSCQNQDSKIPQDKLVRDSDGSIQFPLSALALETMSFTDGDIDVVLARTNHPEDAQRNITQLRSQWEKVKTAVPRIPLEIPGWPAP